MKNRFYTSDHHFNHANILKFLRNNGEKLRDFSSVEEMNEFLIDRWNSVVKEGDTVVHLGDFVFRSQDLSIAERLNGRKILIRGNHDILGTKKYMEYSAEIRGMEVLPDKKMIFTHIPIHPESVKKGWWNIHGHTHYQDVVGRYINISVERTGYTPVTINQIKEMIKEKEHEQLEVLGQRLFDFG